jgi:hypothetical protein
VVPGFYLLYLVAQDESYSIGRWVQLRAAGADGASTFAGSAMRAVPEASARFETTASERVTHFQSVQVTVLSIAVFGLGWQQQVLWLSLAGAAWVPVQCMPAQWFWATV